VTRALQLTGSFTRLQMHTERRLGSTDDDVEAYGDQNAKNLFTVQSQTSLPYRLELNTDVRFVGAIPGQDVTRYWMAACTCSVRLRVGGGWV
jgi:hypothetical protein